MKPPEESFANGYQEHLSKSEESRGDEDHILCTTEVSRRENALQHPPRL
jgi:hypothetical protein